MAYRGVYKGHMNHRPKTAKINLGLYDRVTLPVWCKSLSNISSTCRVITNFVLKFPRFRFRGNKGRSGINFNDTAVLSDTEIPCMVQYSRLYILYKPSNSQFCAKIPNFSFPWQQWSARSKFK